MTSFYADGVAEVTLTAGTGPYALGGALPGRTAFAAAKTTGGTAIADGDTVFYRCSDEVRQEIGLAVYEPGVLTPTEIYSPGGKIDWPGSGQRILSLEPASAAQIDNVYSTIVSTAADTAAAAAADIGGYSSLPHTWTAKQTYSSSDGTVGVLIRGGSKGVVFLPSAGGMTVKGTDQAGAGSQPLTLDGSSLTVTPAATFQAAITVNAVSQFNGLGTIAVSDGTLGLIIHGGSKGLRVSPNGTYTLIEGVDSTGVTSYQPLWVGGSEVAFSISGVEKGKNNTDGGLTWGAPTGGSKGAGTINAQGGLYINGTGLQTVATNSQNTTAAPTGSTSGTGVHMGLAAAITPTRSGTIEVTIYGTSSHSNSGGSMGLQIRTGTGTAPTNGAALTGTAQGLKINPNTAAVSQKMAFSLTVIVSGLTVGVAVWADLSLDNGGAGTATVQNAVVTIREL